ncbi:MAG: acyl-CoA dehydratase activase [Bacilli bacterium]|jgi:predicted CoA-substrate-specific enzyme activase
MKSAYLGVDVGSISTKGIVIDENNNILAEDYLWTEGNPVLAVKKVIDNLEKKLKFKPFKVRGVGVTGSARRLIGTILEATVIKNEITAHAVGTLSLHPDVKTILEIGGQDSKIIIIDKGIVIDYAMNTLCAAGTGAFLASQAKRLGIAIEDFGGFALQSKNPTKIAARCTVFAESDLIHKAQTGHQQEDIIAGLCQAVVNNYLNNVGKGKRILAPIVFQGGVSKNVGVIKAFKETLQEEIITDECGHLTGALGVAILAKEDKKRMFFNFNIKNINFETKGIECQRCPNKCDIICVYKDGKLIDFWGNRCERGAIEKTTLK